MARPKPLNQGLFFETEYKAFLQKGLRSAGGPKLLKWGLPGRGSNLLKSRRLLIYYPRVADGHTNDTHMNCNARFRRRTAAGAKVLDEYPLMVLLLSIGFLKLKELNGW